MDTPPRGWVAAFPFPMIVFAVLFANPHILPFSYSGIFPKSVIFITAHGFLPGTPSEGQGTKYEFLAPLREFFGLDGLTPYQAAKKTN